MRAKASWPCVCLLACAAGCHALALPRGGGDAPVRAVGAAATRPEPRTMPVDLVFVRFDEHDLALGEELWNAADEQAVEDGLRRRLAANGLRIGVIAGDLPPDLAVRILPAPGSAAADAVATDQPFTHRRLRLLPGRRSEIVAVTDIDELVLLEQRDEQVRGGTFHAATGLFELKVQPAADGRVRIDLVPEIRHGPIERAWVGADGMFRMEAGQRRHRRDDLAVSLVVRDGGLLVLGCTADRSTTLGDALLRDQAGDRSTSRLLVIRPAGPTVDPMFATAAGTEAADESDEVLEVR